MGLFKRRATEKERLQELDRRYRNSRDQLNHETVSGYLIHRKKNFEQLERYLLQNYGSEEKKRFILSRVAMNCIELCHSYETESSTAIASVLFEISQDFESHIRLLARNN